jgi:glycosyltransferase involved in cell wall biosynthesis
VTVWYDVTTTMRAISRNGIANVEWSVGSAMRAADADVRFFALQGRAGLREVDAATSLSQAFYAADEVAAPTVAVTVPTWRDGVRHVLRDSLGPYATPVIRTISSLYQAPRRLSRRIKSGGVRAIPEGRALADTVGPGDVVVSLGADWEGEVAGQLGELKRRSGCRVVTMVFDLIPLTHPHLAFHNDPRLFERYYAKLLEISDLIVCISEQSRQDLLWFGRSTARTAPRAEVLVLGETVPPHSPTDLHSRGDFFLWVGTVERRKNLELLYDALRILESESTDLPRIVVAGAKGWGTADLIAELEQQSTAASRAIVMLGPVDDATLDRLYRRAKALLFPSHYEGWGLPVREAAVRGCPVAVGDSSAVREAAAGFAGATFLPVDDPMPWADYLRKEPPPAAPVPVRSWAETAHQLAGFLAEL